MIRRARNHAFTIVETLVACAVVGVALSALAATSIAMQRSLISVRSHSAALGAQSRIVDYIRRDLRNALSVTVLDSGRRLRVELPDDYDTQGNPVDPTIGTGRTVVYGTSGARLSALYFLDGANFVRDVAGTKRVVAADVADFQPAFRSVLLAGKPVAISLDLTFSGQFGFNRSVDTAGRLATRLTTEMAFRNQPVALPPTTTPPPPPTSPKRKGR